jgi:hypothetical protein
MVAVGAASGLVYMLFADRETSEVVGSGLSNLKKYAVGKFTICNTDLEFEGKPIG